jgi:hypothetical protein
MTDEMTATGTASWKVRRNAGCRAFHAFSQDATVHCDGRFHWPVTPISEPALKLVTISTYAGISTTIRKNSASVYLTIAPASGRSAATGTGSAVRETGSRTVVMLVSPPGWCRSGTERSRSRRAAAG